MTTIRVTEEHIKAGMKRHSCLCPIALACKDALPGCHVTVMSERIIIANGFVRGFDTTQTVRKFISRFDLNLAVQPFTFEIP